MNQLSTRYFDKQLYYRLIAVWVIFEGLIGGIIFGLKIPVSGLIVGSGAITCISLIAYYFPEKGAVIKATILVAIFKMILSPHTPPMAYIAVMFQGLLGELLFWNRRWFSISCWLFASIAMAESAVQRILVLLILYGKNFWMAVNDSIAKIFHNTTVGNFTLWLAAFYILFHILVGWIIVWVIFKLIREAKTWQTTLPDYIFPVNNREENIIDHISSGKKPYKKYLYPLIGLLSILILLAGNIGTLTQMQEGHFIIVVITRAIFIMLTWYFLLMPLFKKIINRLLDKEKIKQHKDIAAILLLLPATKSLISKSWKFTAGQSKLSRVTSCCKIILANSIYPYES